MKRIFITGLLTFSAFASFSQKKIEYVEYNLSNGIHVILYEEYSIPIVKLSAFYRVLVKND